MIYPGTAPIGSFGHDPNSLEQRKQQLLQQMASGGIRNNLSFGGSMGDAPGHSPSLSFNPFFSAMQAILGNNNAGQANNAAVSAQPFFGNNQFGQNIGSNVQQAAAVSTGAASGSAGIGGVAGSPAAAPGGVSNPQQSLGLAPGAGRPLFDSRQAAGGAPPAVMPQPNNPILLPTLTRLGFGIG